MLSSGGSEDVSQSSLYLRKLLSLHHSLYVDTIRQDANVSPSLLTQVDINSGSLLCLDIYAPHQQHAKHLLIRFVYCNSSINHRE